jgi:hypothetical protein
MLALRRNARMLLVTVAVVAFAAACSSTSRSIPPTASDSMPAMSDMPGMSSAAPMKSTPESTMSGMDMAGDPGRGLAATESGYTLDLSKATMPANQQTTLTFRITGPGGKPVTEFIVEQTKMLHFYLVRSDLTGYQHLHPQLATDGIWTVPVQAGSPGSYRAYADFTPKSAGTTFVLSRLVTVPGASTDVTLPAPAGSTDVDGYTVTLTGAVMAGMSMPLTAEITRAGQAVTDLQPYLDTYAHLTAFQAGTLAFTHLHPEQAVTAAGSAPAKLTFQAQFAAPGLYRLFMQFQTAGTLHTAAITLKVNGQ